VRIRVWTPPRRGFDRVRHAQDVPMYNSAGTVSVPW